MSSAKSGQSASGVGTLMTSELLALEGEAIRIFDHPVMKISRRRIADIFLADRNAGVDRQRELIRQDADEHAFAAVLAAVAETPERPVLYWSLTYAHRDAGLQVPGSRFGIDNPDNVYRLGNIDDRYRYRITGCRAAVPPIDGGITVLPAQLGENIMANSVNYLDFESLQIESDGRFEITADASPPSGRPNHLNIAGGKALLVRDTQADWLTETPYALAIECLESSVLRKRTDAEVATRAAAYGELMASFFLERLEHNFFERGAPNTVSLPKPSGRGGGLVTQTAAQGWYRLAEDEALIVDVDLMGARYFGFQIADLWMVSYDYTERMSSLNHHEAAVDHDGRVRFVISGTDPGVYNWLDGSGHRVGTTTLRWQHVPNGRTPDASTVISRVVKLDALTKVLPNETRMAEAHLRDNQRATRSLGWKRRCGLID